MNIQGSFQASLPRSRPSGVSFPYWASLKSQSINYGHNLRHSKPRHSCIQSTGNDKAPTASSQNPKEVDQVDIVAQDQGGQEFDPLASKAQGSETPESSSVRNEAASSKEEVVEDDQGGQDFEPLKAKRAVDWSEEKQ